MSRDIVVKTLMYAQEMDEVSRGIESSSTAHVLSEQCVEIVYFDLDCLFSGV